MAQPPRGPEMWIEQDPGTRAGGPGDQAGKSSTAGRIRWIGLILGFAALVAVIAVQHFVGAGQDPGRTSGMSAPLQPTKQSPHPAPSTSLVTSGGVPRSSGSQSPTSDTATGAGHGTAPDTANVGARPLPSSDWELVGLQWSGTLGRGPSAVIRYEARSGDLITTPVPGLASNGPLSFIATSAAAIVRPLDRVAGYTVPGGGVAAAAAGAIDAAARLFPPAADGTFWAAVTSDGELALEHVAADGSRLGQRVPMASTMARDGVYSLAPDGAGYVLATGIGGTYQVRGDGPHLVTRGKVIAAGPAGWLTLDCDHAASCTTITVDRVTGQRTLLRLTDFAARNVPLQGVMSSNGRFAAVLDTSHRGTAIVLLDLATGATTTVANELHGMYVSDTAPVTAFTADNKLLLVSIPSGILPIDTATGDALPMLPLPPLAAFALLPAS